MEFQDWGLTDYVEALEKQEILAGEIAQSQVPGILVFCSHPPIVTKGRATKTGDITTWSGPQIEISRGGRATYHGPSQLVIYPIWNLALSGARRPAKDVGIFLRNFENAIVQTMAEFGISAQGKTYREPGVSRMDLEDTGVWYGDRKIASLGITVRKWVSFHGAALNVEHDPEAFKGLLPCGYKSEVMVSMEEILRAPPDREKLKALLKKKLQLLI